jgi:hypothetical protein
MKKIIITLTILLCSTSVLAAQQHKPLFFFTITGPWLSAAGNSDYGENHSSAENITNPAVKSHNQANLKFSFIYMNNDATSQVSYSNYVTHWNTNSLANSDFNNNSPYSYQGTNALTTFSFTHGYNIQFTKTLLVNIHAGFSYKVLHDSTELNGTPVPDKKDDYLQQGTSDFSGFGPTIGFTLQRKLIGDFSFSNQADLSLAYGGIKTYSIQADNVKQANSPEHNILVPGIDMSIALDYVKLFSKQYIGVDTGMIFKQLFNVANSHNGASNQYQDVAFYGPFLRLRYGF